MSLAMMLRQVQQVPAGRWQELLDLEKRMDEAEAAAGYPLPRRYRAMFGGERSNVRVCERIFESFAGYGRLAEQRFQNDALQRLDGEQRRLLDWWRDELYYLDSGAPVPRWMQAVSRKPFDPTHIGCAIPRRDPPPMDPERVRENIEAGKLRVMYRQIQLVPRDRWAEKLEQERLSDEAEAAAGHPLPFRYRYMYGVENSHVRVSEREYESLQEMCAATERFFEETTPADSAVMDAEARRQDFFAWEREELYIVDSDSFAPRWI